MMNFDNLFSVRGKVALVTGGSRGIGEMIAAGFVARGAKVYISSRKAETCEATAQRLSAGATAATCIALPADLSRMEGVYSLAKRLKARESKLDILVNNAGAAWGAPDRVLPEIGWDKVMDTNVKAVFFLTQQLLPLLRAAGAATGDGASPARVINIGSIDGLKSAIFDTFSYGASKAAVHHLTSGQPPDQGPHPVQRLRRGRSRPGCCPPAWASAARPRRGLGRGGQPQPQRPRRHAAGHRRPGDLPEFTRRRVRRRPDHCLRWRRGRHQLSRPTSAIIPLFPVPSRRNP
jgi:NAD(P)-dependent dehydrogenase (short-subunit alcohol dehydrogenase family)